MVRRNEKVFRKDENKELPTRSKTLDEVIIALEQCLWNDGGINCPTCPYHGTENGQCGWKMISDAEEQLKDYQKELEKCCNECDCYEDGRYCKLHSIFVRSDFACRDWESKA